MSGRSRRAPQPRKRVRQRLEDDPEEDADDLEDYAEQDENGDDDDEEFDEEDDEPPKKRGKGKAPAKSQNDKKRAPRKRKDDDEEYEGETKKTAIDELDEHEKENMINDFMRFALFMDSRKLPIKREDISKNVIPEGHRKKKGILQQMIIPEAKKRFAEIFGFELIEIEKREKDDEAEGESQNPIAEAKSQKAGNKPKVAPAPSMWILRLLDTADVQQRASELQDETDGPAMALLMVILTLIHAQNGPIGEDSMWDHLSKLGVNKGHSHPVFGQPEKVIEKLTKELYLEKQKDENAKQNQAQNDYVDPNAKKTFYAYKRGTRLTNEMEADTIHKYANSIIEESGRVNSVNNEE